MSDKSHTKKEAARLSRRSFIKGAGAAAAVASLVGMRPATSEAEATTQAATEGIAERIGPDAHAIELKINGQVRRLSVEPRVTLLRALREHLGLTGTKLVCDGGACTVHLDGKTVTSCMVLAIDARSIIRASSGAAMLNLLPSSPLVRGSPFGSRPAQAAPQTNSCSSSADRGPC